jgi:transposase-like protein
MPIVTWPRCSNCSKRVGPNARKLDGKPVCKQCGDYLDPEGTSSATLDKRARQAEADWQKRRERA